MPSALPVYPPIIGLSKSKVLLYRGLGIEGCFVELNKMGTTRSQGA